MNSRSRPIPVPWRAALLFAPVALSLLLQIAVVEPLRRERSVEVLLERVRAQRAQELSALFAAHAYPWPVQGAVPRFALKRLPGDLNSLTAEAKKTLFFRAVLPLVVAENERVQRQREMLTGLFAKGELPLESHDYRLATLIARDYGVAGDVNGAETRARLLERVDTIPVALALAQAADESAWGTSRFSREGNSLFGQWTWVRGQGLVPMGRAPGKGHLVRSFPDLRNGVRAYFYNLNMGHAYDEFRRMRGQMRASGTGLDPLLLARGLARYSERGGVYVEEIRGLMKENELLALGESLTLR